MEEKMKAVTEKKMEKRHKDQTDIKKESARLARQVRGSRRQAIILGRSFKM